MDELRERVFEMIDHVNTHIYDVRKATATDTIEAIWDEFPECTLTMDQLDYYLVEWENQH